MGRGDAGMAVGDIMGSLKFFLKNFYTVRSHILAGMTVVDTPHAPDGAQELGENFVCVNSKIDEYKLRSVVKDQRVQPALHAAYCHINTAVPCGNLLLVLTESTLTIYDDFHKGDHVAIVAQYVHEDEVGEEKTSLVSAAWMPGALDSEKNAGSARILLALSNGSLAVVDIIESKITQMFDGAFDASGYVLMSAPSEWVDGKEHVCVLGGDAKASVWNVAKEARVASIDKAVSAVAYVDGMLVAAYGASAGGGVGVHDVDGNESAVGLTGVFAVLGGDEIDSILPVGENMCVLRSEREFRLWNMANGTVKSTFRLKETRDQSEVAFDANGTVAVLGTEDGDGHVFDVQTGEKMGQISVVRVSSEVEAVAVSRDGRHVILAAAGFLFRFLK